MCAPRNLFFFFQLTLKPAWNDRTIKVVSTLSTLGDTHKIWSLRYDCVQSKVLILSESIYCVSTQRVNQFKINIRQAKSKPNLKTNVFRVVSMNLLATPGVERNKIILSIFKSRFLCTYSISLKISVLFLTKLQYLDLEFTSSQHFQSILFKI